MALDRLGDAVGGGLVRLAVVFVPLAQSSTILSAAMATSVGAIVAASHLNRWYVRTLERSLVNQGGGIDLSDTNDGATAQVLLSIRQRHEGRQGPASAGALSVWAADGMIQDILSLRSGNRERVINVLSRSEGLEAGLVPHVIPLLASDPVADYAMFALRKVAEERVGELLDALLDPNQDYAVRRRLARVFSVGVSQRAADGLMLALDDSRFDVRFQSARSLAAIAREESGDPHRPAAGRGGGPPGSGGQPADLGKRASARRHRASESPLDEFVRDRAGQSLAHVFTLLSLVLPRNRFRSRFGAFTPTTGSFEGRRWSTSRGCCPPTSARAFGRSSSIGAARPSARSARKSSRISSVRAPPHSPGNRRAPAKAGCGASERL